MADIAILVAEEYERRIKTSRKINGSIRGAEPTTTVALGGGVASEWVKKAEEVIKELEPRSQMGVAAFSGFFSA